MKVYVVLSENDYGNYETYVGVYSSEESAEKGIEKEMIRLYSRTDLRSLYTIIEQELE